MEEFTVSNVPSITVPPSDESQISPCGAFKAIYKQRLHNHRLVRPHPSFRVSIWFVEFSTRSLPWGSRLKHRACLSSSLGDIWGN